MVLHQYYSLNIVPILLLEILGDLNKPTTDSFPQNAVANLANKALPASVSINVYYRNLLLASLLGQDIPLRGVPVLTGGKHVVDASGKPGIIFEESPEERALARWREGDFKTVEPILADRWRTSTRAFDLELFQKHLKQSLGKLPSVFDLKSLKNSLDSMLVATDHQGELLKLLIMEFGFPIEAAQAIFYRWETAGCNDLTTFAPYGAYCLLLDLFFKFALVHNLIGTKRTNMVDIEYLYYLPFCMVFCSGDNFHSDLVPLFLRDNQRFVQRDDMKKDLGMIGEQTKGKRLDSFTGEGQNSLTAKLWRELMARPLSEQRNLAAENDGELRDKVADFIRKKIADSTPNKSGATLDVNDADFVIRQHFIRGTDPCPCGSGQAYIECCHVKVLEAERRKTDANESADGK